MLRGATQVKMAGRATCFGRWQRTGRPAAAIVEFALIAPLLFTLILGIIEFGRAMMVLDLLNNAARAGCRVGVLGGSDNTAITSAVTTSLSASGVSGSTVTVKVNSTTANASTAVTGDAVTVTVSIPIASVTWVPKLQFLSGTTLTANVTMRRE